MISRSSSVTDISFISMSSQESFPEVLITKESFDGKLFGSQDLKNLALSENREALVLPANGKNLVFKFELVGFPKPPAKFSENVIRSTFVRALYICGLFRGQESNLAKFKKEDISWESVSGRVTTPPKISSDMTTAKLYEHIVKFGHALRDSTKPFVHRQYVLNVLGALADRVSSFTAFGLDKMCMTVNNIAKFTRNQEEWLLLSVLNNVFPPVNNILPTRDQILDAFVSAYRFKHWLKANKHFSEHDDKGKSEDDRDASEVQHVSVVSRITTEALAKFPSIRVEYVKAITRSICSLEMACGTSVLATQLEIFKIFEKMADDSPVAERRALEEVLNVNKATTMMLNGEITKLNNRIDDYKAEIDALVIKNQALKKLVDYNRLSFFDRWFKVPFNILKGFFW